MSLWSKLKEASVRKHHARASVELLQLYVTAEGKEIIGVDYLVNERWIIHYEKDPSKPLSMQCVIQDTSQELNGSLAQQRERIPSDAWVAAKRAAARTLFFSRHRVRR